MDVTCKCERLEFHIHNFQSMINEDVRGGKIYLQGYFRRPHGALSYDESCLSGGLARQPDLTNSCFIGARPREAIEAFLREWFSFLESEWWHLPLALNFPLFPLHECSKMDCQICTKNESHCSFTPCWLKMNDWEWEERWQCYGKKDLSLQYLPIELNNKIHKVTLQWTRFVS